MGIAQVVEKKGGCATGLWALPAWDTDGAPSPHCFYKGLTRQGLGGGGWIKDCAERS